MDELPVSGSNCPTPVLRKRVLFISLSLAFCCYGFFQWVLWPVQVVGDSMLPSYRNGTRNLINKLSYWTNEPRRGDVVALRSRSGEVWIKRIVGLPRETVAFSEGKVIINDKPLIEPYIKAAIPWETPDPITLGPDEFYVFGDNRATSAFGPVHKDHIIGKVVF